MKIAKLISVFVLGGAFIGYAVVVGLVIREELKNRKGDKYEIHSQGK